ncbi:MAG TPA: response regulator [Chryseolinea sp.]|nr:response regulator [Chryseolinea sp.]
MKILIVDDEALDLFIARTLLQTEFEVEGFTTLNECVAWASLNDFDAVLIDYYLDTDTYATHVLAALQQVKPVRIRNAFVLSNFVDSNQFNNLKKAGFEDVIHKPISLDVIRAKLGVTP